MFMYLLLCRLGDGDGLLQVVVPLCLVLAAISTRSIDFAGLGSHITLVHWWHLRP